MNKALLSSGSDISLQKHTTCNMNPEFKRYFFRENLDDHNQNNRRHVNKSCRDREVSRFSDECVQHIWSQPFSSFDRNGSLVDPNRMQRFQAEIPSFGYVEDCDKKKDSDTAENHKDHNSFDSEKPNFILYRSQNDSPVPALSIAYRVEAWPMNHVYFT